MVLATTILASSLAFIDGSVVNVGLPAIGQSLQASGGDLTWVVNAYLLPLSALLLLGGAAGDRFGRRLLLLLGIALFSAASLLCALAPSLPWLLAGRALQGIGAAMLMPNSLAILGTSFSGPARGRAIGIWAAAGAAAGALGPLLGGWLIDSIGWRSVFFINLPIAAAAFVLALRWVQDVPTAQRPALDWLGATLATAGLASLTWGLTAASSPDQTSSGPGWLPLLAMAAGVLLLGLFIWAEDRRGDAAMMPLELFGSRSFAALSALTFLLYGALGALFVLVPTVLIAQRGYSATAAGAALLPLPVVLALLSPRMGKLAGKLGPRLPLTIGPLVVAAGFALAMRIGQDGSYWTTTFPALLVIALGMAGAVAPLTTAVLASVQAQHTGVASGSNSALARSGGLVATALLGALLQERGAALQAMFQWAVLAGAAAALAAGLCAWFGLKRA
jgi:EmrB/QacA subfamily drug resistance transporter